MSQLYDNINYNLKQFDGKHVMVHIEHTIYGKQKAKCIFQSVLDEEKIGFMVNRNYIYLYYNEIEDILCNENCLKILGNMISVTINIV